MSKAITFIRPGIQPNGFIEEVYYSATDSDVDNNFTNIQSTGTFNAGIYSGVAVAYARRWNPAIIGGTAASPKVIGGTVAAADIYGAIPSTNTQLVEATTSVALANGANSNIALVGLSNFARITGPTGAFSISGFASGADGVTLTIWNSTSQTMTITNNATSTAANRILTGTGADMAIAGNGAVSFTYSAPDTRWLLTSGEAASGTGTVTSFSTTVSGLSVATATTTPALSGTVAVAGGGTGGTTIPTAQVGLGIQQAVVATDVTNATTSLASITGLAFTIATAGTYYFRACLFGTSPDTNGIKVGVTLPASATMLVSTNGNTSGVTAYSTDRISASATAGIAYLSYNGSGQLFVEGTVVSGGTGGSVQLTFLKVTSGTGTISAKSNIVAMQIA